MLRVNEHRLYELGSIVHPFSESLAGKKYGQVFIDIWNARIQLLQFIDDPLVPIKICKPSANKVVSAMNSIVPWDVVAAMRIQGDEEITWNQSNDLAKAVTAFETILAAEMQELDTYFVSQKGAFSTYDLIERAHIAIPDHSRLSEDAKRDFDLAGRCLAFDLATAAGFHLVRSIESILRLYYKTVTGVMPKVKDRNWGAFIKVLEKHKDANQKIVIMLKNIKDEYRNPILHPEETLTSAKALIMFTVFAGAAVALLEEIDSLYQRSPTLAFGKPDSGFSTQIGEETHPTLLTSGE